MSKVIYKIIHYKLFLFISRIQIEFDTRKTIKYYTNKLEGKLCSHKNRYRINVFYKIQIFMILKYI
jgi:hypothetical protein